jgi:hypothetical protein
MPSCTGLKGWMLTIVGVVELYRLCRSTVLRRILRPLVQDTATTKNLVGAAYADVHHFSLNQA